MKAWRIKDKEQLKLENIVAEVHKEHFVKVKVTYSAISGMDALLYKGDVVPNKYPITIGRQAVGMVTEVGENVTSLERGDRVVVDPYIFCDECTPCKDDNFTSCADIKAYGTNENGLLSDFCIVRCEDLFKLPDRISDKEAIFSGHIALALNIATKLNIEKGKHIAIMGASTVGLALAQIALYYQAIPIVVDSRQDRLNIAEKVGVYYCINATTDDVRKKMFSYTGGALATSVAHLVGSSSTIEQTLDSSAFGANIVIAGWSGSKVNIKANLQDVFNKQLHISAVTNGAKMISSAINMLANRTVVVNDLISSIVPFLDVAKALKEKIEYPHKDIKVLVKM